MVGESGSGKSVTSKTLLNLNDNAEVSINSIKIDDIKTDKYKKLPWKKIRGEKVAYIAQNPMTSLNPTRKIKKQITDVLEKYRPELKSKEEKNKYIIDMLTEFGINNPEMVINQYPFSLSGGMKQRIVIALTIATNAKIIVADEPTTALDPTVQASVLNLLKESARKYNVSIIFISHDISVIARMSDYVYVMYAGKVVEKGTAKEIFTNPAHPYTWALLLSTPDNSDKKLYSIPGTPPDMENLPPGDPFAPRNKYAVDIDFRREPPLFEISKTHYAATWMLHPSYPKTKKPEELEKRLKNIKKAYSTPKRKGKNEKG